MVMDKTPVRDGLDRHRRLHVNCASSALLKKLIQHFSANEALSEIACLERADLGIATATWILPTSATRKVLQPKLCLGSEDFILHSIESHFL